MNIEQAIEQVRGVIEYLGNLQYEHEEWQDSGEEAELPECLFDVDVYWDGSYSNLVDAQETLISGLDLLLELRRLHP